MSLETDKKTVAAIFPGQGAQYVGMAKDFIENFSTARLLFEEADEILKCSLSKIILQGPLEELTKTKNSQVAIYVTSMAIYSVAQELYNFQPKAYAGLSLGEYSALTAGQYLSFEQTLLLVRLRGELMNQACQARPGTMAIAIGLDCAQVEKLVKEINLPNDLWIANYNCPGQIVLSGSLKGIEQASLVAKEHGAKRFLPLNVHGAFHSGLMQPAQEKLAPFLQQKEFKAGKAPLVMNVSASFVAEAEQIKTNLIQQVTQPVRWEQSIEEMKRKGIDLCIEFGPGKTLAGLNRRMHLNTLSIEKVEELEQLASL